MDIEDEIARALREKFNASRGRDGVSPDVLASRLMPLVKRAQAEARVQGFSEGVNFIDNDPSPSWGGSMVAGRNEAARRLAAIENEGAGAHD